MKNVVHFHSMDCLTANEYLTKYCDDFEKADSQEKGNLFMLTNGALFKLLNCPRQFVVDLETHGFLFSDEVISFNDISNVTRRMMYVFGAIRHRTTSAWENLPLFISIMRPYNEEVATKLQARWDAVSMLIR